MRRRRGPSLLTILYLVIGAVVASNHHYFEHLGGVKAIVSAFLAVVAWPLVLLHVNLHVGTW
jgi:hypothetical protein